MIDFKKQVVLEKLITYKVSLHFSVHKLDSSECKLLDFAKKGRPLVLNFGSCTWPPFMAKFELFIQTARDFSHVADFLTVYIQEAHPANGWYFYNNYVINTHTSLEERLSAARLLEEKQPPFPIVVDAMNSNASYSFGVKYERLHIIQDGVCVFVGGDGPDDYYVEDVVDWLSKYTSSGNYEK